VSFVLRNKILFMLVLVIAVTNCAVIDDDFTADKPGIINQCSRLAELSLPHSMITNAELIASGNFSTPEGKSHVVPSFCRVQGISMPTKDSHINFEVWMPAKNWNGRYYQYGEGGLGGAINYASLAHLLNEGNAVAATDDGHVRDKEGTATWARDEQKVIDGFSFSLKETYENATRIVKAFYHRKPQYHYFSGCSGGGRQAFIAAQRYPQDWDGILAGAPGNDTVRIYSTFAALGKLWRDHPEGRISPKKLPAIQKASISACQKDAFVIDGIAADPRLCRFDPAVLACQDVETDSCLTRAQQSMLESIYNGVSLEAVDGERYSGIVPTTENSVNFKNWITGSSPRNDVPPAVVFLGNRFFRNFIYHNPEWDVAQFDRQVDPYFAKNKMISGKTFSSIADVNSTDLSLLKTYGTKLVVYSGWGDVGILPDDVIAYYEDVVKQSGGLETTQNFFRLFMVPGMAHCKGGPGANAFGQPYGLPGLQVDATHDITKMLEAWVEHDATPEQLVVTKYIADDPNKGVSFTRPICAYPTVPAYKGSGNPDFAENFRCVAGRAP